MLRFRGESIFFPKPISRWRPHRHPVRARFGSALVEFRGDARQAHEYRQGQIRHAAGVLKKPQNMDLLERRRSRCVRRPLQIHGRSDQISVHHVPGTGPQLRQHQRGHHPA